MDNGRIGLIRQVSWKERVYVIPERVYWSIYRLVLGLCWGVMKERSWCMLDGNDFWLLCVWVGNVKRGGVLELWPGNRFRRNTGRYCFLVPKRCETST